MASVSKQLSCFNRMRVVVRGMEYHCPMEKLSHDWRKRPLPPTVESLGEAACTFAVAASE